MKKIIIDETKLGEENYWETLFKAKEEVFKKPKKVSKKDLLVDAYKKSPDNIRLNKEWALKALRNHSLYLFHIEDSIKDLQFCIDYIEQNTYPSLYGIPKLLQAELFDKIIVKNTYVVKDLWYDQNLKHLNTRENLIKWIEQNPEVYLELGKYNSFKNDFGLAEIAVRTEPKILFKMSKSIARKIVSRNLDISLDYFDKEVNVFNFLPLKVRNDKDFILKNIKRLSYAHVGYIGKEALQHKEVIMKLNSYYEVDIPEHIIQDKEVALHIISSTNYVYPYIKDCENYTVEELIKQTLLKNKKHYFYEKLSTNYKENPVIISAFLEIGYFEETVKVKKTHNFSNYSGGTYEYEENEWVKTPVVKLLPENVKQDLIEEYKITRETEVMPGLEELLHFAKSKYLQIVLEEKYIEKSKVKRMKI